MLSDLHEAPWALVPCLCFLASPSNKHLEASGVPPPYPAPGCLGEGGGSLHFRQKRPPGVRASAGR